MSFKSSFAHTLVIFIIALCLLLFSSSILYFLVFGFPDTLVKKFPQNLSQNLSQTILQKPNPPNISAKYAIVIDGDTLEILYEKNSHEKAYPASITKIMTALIAIETLEKYESPPSQLVTVSPGAVGIEGSSIYLSAGELLPLQDLLFGMMLRSGNDAATAISMIIGGNTTNFAQMMNERAHEIGCTNTNFVNPHGLFDENHYTSAYDMALISAEAMKFSLFRDIAAAKDYTGNRAPDKYNYFYNKNKVVHQYEGGTGIKIGYTQKSGRTLVASASKNDRNLICVVMSAPDWFNDAYTLFDFYFN